MIFSDKTGTLTMNKMIFKKCQVLGEKYGEPQMGDMTQVSKSTDGMTMSGVSLIRQKLKEESKRFYQEVLNPHAKKSVYDYPFFNFVKVMTLCHSVVCDVDQFSGEIRYQASSPDELALVQGAKSFGMQLVARNHSRLEVENRLVDMKEIFKVVSEFPFDSTRKCMSVIVKD